MYFNIGRREFYRMLGAVKSCADASNVGSYSKKVKLKVDEDGTVSASAANGVTSVISRGTCEFDREPGGCVVNHSTLYGMVGKMDGDGVVVALDKSGCVIKCGKVKTVMGAEPEKVIPEPPDVRGTVIGMRAEALGEVIAKTRYAIAKDDPRAVLNGLYIKAQNGALTAVGMDGFVMAMHETRTDSRSEFEAIIPFPALKELQLMSGDAEISVAGTQFRAVTADVTLYSTLIAGKYIDYTKFREKAPKNRVTCLRAELLASFERSVLVCSPTNNPRRVRAADGKLTVEVADATGSYSDFMDGMVDGEGINTAFSSQYMIDALRGFDGEFVTIAQESALSSAMITSESDAGHFAVVLPVRVSA